MTELLRFEGIVKRYGHVVALDGIDLSVPKGEFLTLLGPSGSGKTTLLNVVAGTIPATSGRLWLAGRDVGGLPSSERRLGMVFQNYALFPHMTIYENVAFGLRVRRAAESEVKRKVAEALSLVQLPDVGARKPKELSGGQQQRIAIARCLVYNPDLILMDEPLGALDKKLRDQMQLEIKRLHGELGLTILYVTHDQGEALVMSDRICLMNAGRIEQAGTPRELYFSPKTAFAAEFLGESNILPRALVMGAGDGSVMLRPECVRLHVGGQPSAGLRQASIEDVIFVGGATRVRLRLAGGGRLTAKRLTSAADHVLKPGDNVLVDWDPRDVVTLPGTIATG